MLNKFLLSIALTILFLPLINNAQTSGKKTMVKKSEFTISELERAVLNQVNYARYKPHSYAKKLKKHRKMLKGNTLHFDDGRMITTREGHSAIDEAIKALQNSNKTHSLKISKELTKAARFHLNELKEGTAKGHFSADGSSPSQRLAKFGQKGKKIGENISYRYKKASEIVSAFLIDDGVSSRLHRRNILNPLYKVFGVACGEAKKTGFACVLVFADSFTPLGKAKPKVKEIKEIKEF